MNYGTYQNLVDMKTALGITDTTDDARLLAALESVSRWIDNYCQRHFFVITATRTFTAIVKDYLDLEGAEPDLLSITSLKADEDDDWDYDNTWDTGDYHLLPFNDFPKRRVKTKAGGSYRFSSQEEGVQIVGQWGYGNGQSATPYEDSQTTTAEELDASETGVDVTDATPTGGIDLVAGMTILVESEQMYIKSVATNTLTVVRGVNGTTATTHATAKTVYVYRYPQPVVEACMIQTSRIFRRKDAPFGITGSAEFGQATFIARLDPDVRTLLDVYRVIPVG
ncbi:MAG: phage head-tail connector protein [Sulfuricaulis sp.]|nr:phage head-tail connector protein [Sulfuricaulis sp.]